MTVGVSLHELHCPTCRALYEDFNLHSDWEEEFTVEQTLAPISAMPRRPWYIRCPNGHRWTVKTVWRAVNYPDRVQLGEYVGSD